VEAKEDEEDEEGGSRTEGTAVTAAIPWPSGNAKWTQSERR
jgi:hypothetical protein